MALNNPTINIYTENAMDGELTLVAKNVEELLTLINMDRVDIDNNYLVTELQLTDAQREELLNNA